MSPRGVKRKTTIIAMQNNNDRSAQDASAPSRFSHSTWDGGLRRFHPLVC